MKKFLSFFLFILVAGFGYSQSLQIKILSLITEEPVDSVQVFLKNEADNSELSGWTDVSGMVIFSGLSIGKIYIPYTQGNDAFQFASLPGIKIQVNDNRIFTLRLPNRVTNLLGEVLISSSPMAKMNTQNATVSGQMKSVEIQKMPIEGRDITRSLYRLPNVTLAVLGYAEGPNISINGLNGIFTNYLVDGMDNNERFLGNMKINTPVGFVENVTVLTNNYSSEWGNTSNGIVNVLSRSGTNEVTGEVFYLTRPGAVIDAHSDFATRDLSGNEVKDGFQRHQFGFSVGAPIKNDRTFIYVNAEQTIDIKDNLLNSSDLGVNETVRGNNYFSYVNTKVDQVWSKKFRSSLRGQFGRMHNQRQGGGLDGGIIFPSAASVQSNDSYLIALRNQINLNNRIATEINYQRSYYRWNYRQPLNAASPSVAVKNPQGQDIAIIGQSGAIFDDEEYTHQFQNKWFLKTRNHHFKAGVEFISSDFQLTGGGNPNGTYTVQLDNAQLAHIRNARIGGALNVNDIPAAVEVINYEVELRPNSFGKTQNVTSVFIEDSWSVSDRLTANVGLRWDYDNLSKSGGDKGDWNNIAPRLSLNYRLNERSLIRGGYGIYYDKIKYSVYSDALQFGNDSEAFRMQLRELQRLGILDANADLHKITFEGNLKASAQGVDYLKGPSANDLSDSRDQAFVINARILNPNGWDNPYSHQFSLGYQYKPTDETLFIFDAVHTRTEGLYIIKNLNVASPYLFPEGINPDDVVPRSRADADLSRPVPIIGNGFYSEIKGDTIIGGSRNVFMTETAGRAEYTALNFMVQREISDDRMGYRLLYTLSWTKSNTSSVNTRAQDNNDFDAEFAWDENDRRHIISGVFLYQPIKGLIVAPTALIQSGQPVTRVADASLFAVDGKNTGDLNGDGESFGLPTDRWPGEPKNSDRLPWAVTFDVSVKYFWRFKNERKTGIEFSADVFNVLNAQNWSGYNTTRSVSNQIQVGPGDSHMYVMNSASPPRQFQFGARYIF